MSISIDLPSEKHRKALLSSRSQSQIILTPDALLGGKCVPHEDLCFHILSLSTLSSTMSVEAIKQRLYVLLFG